MLLIKATAQTKPAFSGFLVLSSFLSSFHWSLSGKRNAADHRIEIQDILKSRDNIDKIHDKEAAVKYFTFDDDQWVSYDDAETFDQKVEWADSVGLGGLMTWAIDLDDEHFTALSGLIGKPAGKGLNKALAQKEVEIATWSSENGMHEASRTSEATMY